MAVGLSAPSVLAPVAGVCLSATYAGIRKQQADDVVLMTLTPGSQVTCVFTKNAFCAAPVQVAKAHLATTDVRALIINAGNANAGTGAAGFAHAQQTCAGVAKALDIPPESVLPFSTGVIFEPLPIDKLLSSIEPLVEGLDANSWLSAASGIMTTDTLPKGASQQLYIDGELVTITGICKGSGMIRPNMATMLAYIATDAQIDLDCQRQLMHEAVLRSFNSVTVDGDTSTNDSAVLIATGCAKNRPLTPAHPEFAKFRDALYALYQSLAQALVRDGEGATKFIEIRVDNARTSEESRIVGFEIAHSPLVKTALFASDPNLGRILMAIGKAPVTDLDVTQISLWLGDVQVLSDGQPAAGYVEADAQAVMDREDILIRVDMGRGDASASVWTCDLSYDYVRINADYRS